MPRFESSPEEKIERERKVEIREAQEKDLERIFQIEKRSYPPELQATKQILRDRFKTFGIRVAEVDGEVVGFFTCVPIKLDWPKPDPEKLLKNRSPHYQPWFDEYKKGGEFNTLYVTSTAVESEHQGKGIGRVMVEQSLQLAKELSLSYRASVLRMPGYGNYHRETGKSPESYIEEVKEGRADDRFLNLYLKQGFELGEVIENYEPDRASLNYGVFAFKKVE